MKHSTTEISSTTIASDNPVHQRLLYAYVKATEMVRGDLLELGCGTGRGIETLKDHVESYTAFDKIEAIVHELAGKYPDVNFHAANIPPLADLPDNSFDTVVTFQVIEHIQKDKEFLKEIFRVLKPGGQAIITTPNIKQSLSRNPYHIREYTVKGLSDLMERYFDTHEMHGVYGDETMMNYHEENRKSVNRIMRFDIFRMQWWMPAFILRIPYEILNRRNRDKLQSTDDSLVASISVNNFYLDSAKDDCLDLFAIGKKNG
jgi:ubiquinone/menaquinone biosynthesis C-methylase UbiE